MVKVMEAMQSSVGGDGEHGHALALDHAGVFIGEDDQLAAAGADFLQAGGRRRNCGTCWNS